LANANPPPDTISIQVSAVTDYVIVPEYKVVRREWMGFGMHELLAPT
jgi:hypothetical protein